ncbi:hypothetical protein LCGC14_0732760 [marine sediment metagenome]|uniref:Uncharacterized protein n=1 Tax=marine sediment metagenome TaxID=412755 RepID=A0A0F9QTZ3_9ZZZZ
MVEQLGPQTAVVSSKELGTNCWLPKRFVQNGSRCDRIYVCPYPERKTCLAVQAEIDHLLNEKNRLIMVSMAIDNRIQELSEMLEI